jgi:predicted 3-demethylubiquinone-9 3-methyltransferase (glyoxalase superfamily)
MWLVQGQMGIVVADRAAAKRAFAAMMEMGKIDVAAIEKARRG